MKTLCELLEYVRQHPGIVLGRPSARVLDAFLSGFALARKQTVPGDFALLAEFNKWVHDRYEVGSTQGWAKIIEFFNLTEADEMTLFWKIWDEFLSRQSRKQRIAALRNHVDQGADVPRRKRRA